MQPQITSHNRRFDPHHILLAAAITGVFLAGMILGRVTREAGISNPFDDDTRPAVVASAPDAGLDTAPSTRNASSLGVTNGQSSHSAIGDLQYMEQNLYLPESVAPPSESYPLDWQRFLDANGVTGALAEPVVPMERQRFIDMNTYMPGYAVETPATAPTSGEDIRTIEQNLYLPTGGQSGHRSTAEIRYMEQNLYLPTDGIAEPGYRQLSERR